MRSLATTSTMLVAVAACGGPPKPSYGVQEPSVTTDPPSALCVEVAHVLEIVGDIASKEALPATCALVPVKERDRDLSKSNFRVECKVPFGQEAGHCLPFYSIGGRWGSQTVEAKHEDDVIWYRRRSKDGDRPMADGLPPPEMVPDVVAYVTRAIAAFPKLESLTGVALADEPDTWASKLCFTGATRCRFVKHTGHYDGLSSSSERFAMAVLYHDKDFAGADLAFDKLFAAIDGATFPVALTHPARPAVAPNGERFATWNVTTKRAEGDLGIAIGEVRQSITEGSYAKDAKLVYVAIGGAFFTDPNSPTVAVDPNAPPDDWDKLVGDLDWASMAVDHEWAGAQFAGLATYKGRPVGVTSRLTLELKLGTNDIVGILNDFVKVETDRKFIVHRSSGIRGTLDRKAHTLTLRTIDVPPSTKEGITWCGFAGTLKLFRRGDSLTKPILQLRGTVTSTCGNAQVVFGYEYNPSYKPGIPEL